MNTRWRPGNLFCKLFAMWLYKYEECMYMFTSRQMTNLSCPCMHFPARDSVHMTQTSWWSWSGQTSAPSLSASNISVGLSRVSECDSDLNELWHVVTGFVVKHEYLILHLKWFNSTEILDHSPQILLLRLFGHWIIHQTLKFDWVLWLIY